MPVKSPHGAPLHDQPVGVWNVPQTNIGDIQRQVHIGMVDAERHQVKIVVLVLWVDLGRRTQSTIGLNGLIVVFVGFRKKVI